jgi:DNA-binding transcriptional regulator YhcF (GntR family)
MLDSLPFSAMDDPSHDRPGQLVSAVIVAFVQGDLKPGDPFPEPSDLARTCHMPLYEVLDAIASLLSRRILQQDRSGALRIHPKASPTIEMKQHAFLARARQLVGQAHQWHLPTDCLDPLFHKAAHEKP